MCDTPTKAQLLGMDGEQVEFELMDDDGTVRMTYSGAWFNVPAAYLETIAILARMYYYDKTHPKEANDG